MYFSNYFANAILFLNSPMNNISQQKMDVPFLCVSAQKSLEIKKLFCIFKEYFNRKSLEIKLYNKFWNEFVRIRREKYRIFMRSFFGSNYSERPIGFEIQCCFINPVGFSFDLYQRIIFMRDFLEQRIEGNTSFSLLFNRTICS